MKFKLFEEYVLLNESVGSAKVTFLKTGKIQLDVFDKLVEIDPSKTKKYLDKICKYFLESNGANFDELKEVIAKYDHLVDKNLTDKKDINSFKTYLDLKSHVDDKNGAKSKTEVKVAIKKNEATVLVDNDDWFIVSPLTHNASCLYGAGATWCTAMRDRAFWDDYTKLQLAKIYYVTDKKLDEDSDLYRIGVAVFPGGRTRCFSITDKTVEFSYLVKRGVDKNIFQPDKELTGKLLNKWIEGRYKQVGDIFNVKGDVNIILPEGMKHPKIFIQFGTVEGNFDCSLNDLEGLDCCPKVVTGKFECFNNKIKTLDFCPEEVGGDFDCRKNPGKFTEAQIRKVCKVGGQVIV